jgi:hypothetical protein
LSVSFVAARGLARLFHRIRGILTLFALIRILREHLAIDRGNAEHVSNSVTGDRIGHTNDIEVNVWSIELGELARVDFRIPSREIFSDHDVSSLCYTGDFPARLFIPVPYESLAALSNSSPVLVELRDTAAKGIC